ncbi:hypothetical protein BH11ARM2_BH11ARM2_39430 [soil metagenome]
MVGLNTEVGYERMIEAILYVAGRGAQDPRLGLTKIFKTLVIADVLAQSSLGHTVTRWKYMRFKNGPVPLHAKEYLEGTTDVTVMNVPVGFGRTLKRLVAHREPNMALFTDEERNLLDMAMGIACSGTADEASELGHALPAWRWSKPDKLIPGELLGFPYLITAEPATGSSLDLARQSLAEQSLA